VDDPGGHHPAAIITGSPVIFEGAGLHWNFFERKTLALIQHIRVAASAAVSWRSMRKTGRMLWKTFDMPDNGGRLGYSGGAVGTTCD